MTPTSNISTRMTMTSLVFSCMSRRYRTNIRIQILKIFAGVCHGYLLGCVCAGLHSVHSLLQPPGKDHVQCGQGQSSLDHCQALTLIKSLISGGMTPELEIILAEGAGLQPGYSSAKVLDKRNRCKLGQVALTGKIVCGQYVVISHQFTGSPLAKYGEGKYEDLFVAALLNHGMLAIGLYR